MIKNIYKHCHLNRTDTLMSSNEDNQ